jgi:hypothetical protein
MSSDSHSRKTAEKPENSITAEQELQNSLTQIGIALRGLKFGCVNVIVQDGVVVQIDKTEKVRLRNSSRLG